MSKAAKTKQFIIEKTAPLFNTKGYAATSISDLTALTGLTKGSIYGNFSNKDEVVVEAFLYNVAIIKREIHKALTQGSNPKEALLNFVDFYRNYWEKLIASGGCALLNAATEADDHLLFLKASVQHNFTLWINRLAGVIEEGQKEGFFKPNISPTDFASTFVMLVEGGILLSRSMGNKKYLDLALDQITHIINKEISN
ncbi:TetR/AcrR family transcriptional regulator [Myroides sp. WP-1]|uniref:TetR/AcrR family transcriptional regulator n=1 Tax=Myroides sp. WP-1 TaxID=2759944 RepID=UPI0015FA7E49|nr:TetR/AcrR family transcriptional regulator [Myroides sp. WP-1]MBB1138197.1 TetR/AcrR family transcriptional regulator [Myroides sp. WP-1]